MADTKEQRPDNTLGVLEEDDEFEEFAVADWDDSKTDLAHLGGAAPGAAKSGGDKLWEDNWDDDDIEEEFSVQLRSELEKTKKAKEAAVDPCNEESQTSIGLLPFELIILRLLALIFFKSQSEPHTSVQDGNIEHFEATPTNTEK
ncbi:hypothetical protein NP233_g3976 [Leucocoprinus birnbaumii]|uniref:26S proteasome complex subunit SEM1 n=1 Tax=Leucocoprinus birnbaumii TaxID=56174 RepID=A0AAD5YXZ3_9AGAR|nr:hypothetical protein NP233_g3976 [Leucocoprinus birnbaumii]